MPCRGRLLPPPGDQCGSAGEGSWAQCYPEKKALIIGDRGSTRAQEIAREDILPSFEQGRGAKSPAGPWPQGHSLL